MINRHFLSYFDIFVNLILIIREHLFIEEPSARRDWAWTEVWRIFTDHMILLILMLIKPDIS